MFRSLIGLGSNLGDRAATLLTAWELLGLTKGVETGPLSRFYETEPVGGPPQPLYLNAVGIISTKLSPGDLLATLLRIENQLGRVRSEHWGARTIDLDLLLFESMVISSDHLTVPHPRMTERLFVLEPATEIAPDWVHPLNNLSIEQLLSAFLARKKNNF